MNEVQHVLVLLLVRHDDLVDFARRGAVRQRQRHHYRGPFWHRYAELAAGGTGRLRWVRRRGGTACGEDGLCDVVYCRRTPPPRTGHGTGYIAPPESGDA